MKEIKFRAWEKKLKEMITVSTIDFNKEMINTDSLWRYFHEVELMQFTGLLDKNGTEIYEYSELDGAYEVIFKDLRYSLRHTPNNDIIDLHDYWRDKNGEIEVTREYTKV